MLYINNIGSHIDYYYREHNRRFVPDERNMAYPHLYPRQNIVNAYDNTLLETDEFINTVISYLQEQNAVYFYCADHGESLGENGNYIHGSDMTIPEQRYVACFVWMSDQFKRNNPEIAANLVRNARELPVISHEYFFHTVLGLAGIQSPVIDPTRNLCSPSARAFEGDVPAFPAYDEQLKRVGSRYSEKETTPSKDG